MVPQNTKHNGRIKEISVWRNEIIVMGERTKRTSSIIKNGDRPGILALILIHSLKKN